MLQGDTRNGKVIPGHRSSAILGATGAVAAAAHTVPRGAEAR
jgi:hypothetical protein